MNLVQRHQGAILRGPTERKRLALEFTGHDYGEGGPHLLDALARHGARASFLLTGDFLRRPDFAEVNSRIVADGHYLGPHSDRHLLYVGGAGETLVTREKFRADVERNLDEVSRFGVDRAAVRYWIPAYETHNAEIVAWSEELGLTLCEFTPGIGASDWAPDDHPAFRPSREMLACIWDFAATDPHGLNGVLLLLHIGAGPGRTDKFFRLLDELLKGLHGRGYECVRLDELLE
jgi:peptidoglycan/xylan/chitin deacetylase (PgdA/CDA1 family)